MKYTKNESEFTRRQLGRPQIANAPGRSYLTPATAHRAARQTKRRDDSGGEHNRRSANEPDDPLTHATTPHDPVLKP
jgi:uncharacterized protein YlaI